jgi:hypothetical protein
VVVELKPGETITGLAVGWAVERFVRPVEEKPAKKRVESGKKKAAPAKTKSPRSTRRVKGKSKTKPARKKKK